MTRRSPVLFVFLDGVGIGPASDQRNPFLRAHLPVLSTLLGGHIPTLDEPVVRGSRAVSVPLDATLGVDGTPQSGTGQATLLTGENAARIHGSHFGPWTPVGLRPLVEERNLLVRAARAERSVAFANAYPRGWPGPAGSRRVSAPPLAARAAGVLDRHEEALGEGRAVSSEIVNDGWREHLGHGWLPEITEREAGLNLGAIASRADLTLYAYYATDTVGHRGGMAGAVWVLERVDRFLRGVIDALDPTISMLIASDHGNLEDVTTQHTRNPALGIVAGPAADALPEAMRSLTDVVPAVLGWLGVSESPT
jgi:2,3-bisphosphoglycerate-independent phosphoglycerate mutase